MRMVIAVASSKSQESLSKGIDSGGIGTLPLVDFAQFADLCVKEENTAEQGKRRAKKVDHNHDVVDSITV